MTIVKKDAYIQLLPGGVNGYNTATIYLYQRSTSTVTNKPNRILYYKFSTKTLYTDSACTTALTDSTTSMNGWKQNIPSGTDPIWVTAAVANSRTDVDAIEISPTNEWVTPVQFTENGEDGINSATVFVYKRADSIASNDKPVALYYKFGDGQLYKLSSGSYVTPDATTDMKGWTRNIPSNIGTNHYPCWVRQVAALNTTEYDEVSEWSSATKLVEDGDDGNGISSVTRTYAISAQSTTASETTAPTIDGSWASSSPTVTAAYPYLWAKEVVTYTKSATTTKYYMIGARGENGVDAQDIEWVYIRTKTNTAPTIYNDSTYTDSNGKTYTSDGHLPRVSGNANIENNNSNYECTDDPKGVNSTWLYEWEIKRTKGNVDATTHQRSWNYYGGTTTADNTMTLHNNFAESAFIIDTDNDNDQFGTDANSQVLVDQTRSTTVTLYDGATPQTLSALTATLTYEDGETEVDEDVATASTDISTGIVSVTVWASNTPITNTEIQAHITASCTGKGSKDVVFTLYKVMSGAAGLTPIIYQVAPTNKVFSFQRDSSNNLTPSTRSSKINVARTEGNTTTILSTAQTGLTYDWGFDNSSTAQASSQAIGSTITISSSDAASYSSVWVQLSTGDRETLSIVKDGEKGDNGDSITKSSEVSTYKVSDSGTTTPTGTWYATKAAANTAYPWTEDRYMWTKTVITWSDTSTTTLYSAERNPNDGDPGQDIVVDEQEIKYSKQSSGSLDPSTLTYGNYPSTLSQGDWLYVRTTVYYKKEDSASHSHDAGSSVSYTVQYQSEDGDTGRSLTGITEHYKASSSNSASQWSVPSSGTWSGEWDVNPIPSNFNGTNKYLWNYEKIEYLESDGVTTTIHRTSPSIITTYGKAIDSIVNYYKASTKDGTSAANTEGRPSNDPTGSSSSDGWTIAVQTPTSSVPFLWNYEKINYIDVNGVASESYTDPHIICHFGKNGTNGVSVFRWNQSPDSGPSISGTAYPPTGTDSSARPTTGWSKTAPNRPTDAGTWYLWMSTGNQTGTSTVDAWSTPVRISGDTGSAGEDAEDMEWIYKRADTRPSIPASSGKGTAGSVSKNNWTSNEVHATDDWVPDGWADNPSGVDSDHLNEWACYRVKERGATTWSDFKGVLNGASGDYPLLWSHYGERGMDGDGVEYVFMRTKTNVAPALDTVQSGYDVDEFTPTITNKGTGSGQTDAESTTTTDDPKGTIDTWPYEWVAKRSKVLNEDGKTRSWTKFQGNYVNGAYDYKMSLWANWSKDGENAVRLDIDNEMDAVQTDSTGKIMAARTVGTIVRLYDGATEVNISAATISTSGGPVTSGTNKVADYSATAEPNSGKGKKLTWAFIAGKTMTDYEVAIGYTHTDGNTYKATFTINATKGQAVFQLKPSYSALLCTKNANNTLNNPPALSLKVLKVDGGSTSESDATSANLTTLGLTIRYSLSGMPSSASGGTPWPSSNSLQTDTSNTNVYIAMYNSSGTLLDRETIPILKDGIDGVSSLIVDIDNDSDQFGTDSTGLTLTEQSKVTGVKLYYGTTAQTITKIVATVYRAAAPTTSIGSATATTSGTEVSGNITISSTAVGTIKSLFSGQSGTVTLALSNNKTINDDFIVKIDAYRSSTESRSTNFTIKQVKSGQPGVAPDLCNLRPTLDKVSFSKSELSGSTAKKLGCGYTLVTANGTTNVELATTSGVSVNGTTYYVWWRYVDGTYNKFSSSSSIYSTGILPSTLVKGIEFCLSSASSYSGITPENTLDYESVPVIKDGTDGSNAISLSLDNEHEDFLYRSDGTLVAPKYTSGSTTYDGVQIQCRLYDGIQEKTSDVTSWAISQSMSSGVSFSGATAPSISNSGLLTVRGLTENTAKVVVVATYQEANYYVTFTANVTTQDKFDLVVDPSSIAYNPASYSDTTIKVYANRTDLQGNTAQATIATSATTGLRLYATYGGSTSQVTTTTTDGGITKHTISVTGTIAGANAAIYLELRKYTSSSAYTVVDYETVEIAKAEDAVLYSLESSVGSVTIPTGSSSATLSATVTSYKKSGDNAKSAYSCYIYTYTRALDGTLTEFDNTNSKRSSVTISRNVTSASAAIGIVSLDSFLSFSNVKTRISNGNYLAKVEIPIIKDGENGDSWRIVWYNYGAEDVEVHDIPSNADYTCSYDTSGNKIGFKLQQLVDGVWTNNTDYYAAIRAFGSDGTIKQGWNASSKGKGTSIGAGWLNTATNRYYVGYLLTAAESPSGSSTTAVTAGNIFMASQISKVPAGSGGASINITPAVMSVNTNGDGEVKAAATQAFGLSIYKGGEKVSINYYSITTPTLPSGWTYTDSDAFELSVAAGTVVSAPFTVNIVCSASSAGISSITGSITIVPNRKGDASRQPYLWGKWSDFVANNSNTFTANQYEAPYFIKEEEVTSGGVKKVMENKWMWVGDDGEFVPPSATPGTGQTKSTTPSSSDSNWELMVTDFKYLISEAQIANYGKFGSGIFDGDYAFSQYGLIDGTSINHYKNFRPEFFKGQPYVMFNGTKDIGTSYTSSTPFEFGRVYLETGVTYTFVFNCAASWPSGVHVRVTNVSTGNSLADWYSGGSSPVTRTIQGSYITSSTTGEYAVRAYATSGTLKFQKISISADKAFKPNIYIDWLNGEIYSQLGRFVNVTVEGVLNNLIQEITSTNYSSKLYRYSGTYAWLDPLQCGTVIRFTSDFFSGNFANGYRLYLPYALRASDADSEPTIGGLHCEDLNHTAYTLNEVRQCVGKKIYIINDAGNSNGIQFCCCGPNSISLLVQKYDEATHLENIEVANWTYPTVTSGHVTSYGVRRLTSGIYGDSSSGTDKGFIILECKMGILNGTECIYWEISTAPNNLNFYYIQ